MKLLRSLLLSGLTASVMAPAAFAEDTFTIRLPLSAAIHSATTTNFDFGSVIVGTTPRRVFTFTNRGAKPTTLGAIQASGGAKILEHSCVGTLEANQSCDIEMGVLAQVVGVTSGSVAVAHSEAQAPDIWALKATGVTSSSAIRFDEPQVNFGEQLIRQASPHRTLTLRNTGTQAVELVRVGFSSTTSHFVVLDNTCEGSLDAGSSCTVQVAFRPQLLGVLNTTLSYKLSDGVTVNAATLSGVGVQGLPSWSAAEVNFMDVPANTESPAQALTLTNTGKGPLGISSLSILDSGAESEYFRVASTTCAAQLLPGASCQVNVSFFARDTSVRSATLQLMATGTMSPLTRVQLFARPKDAAKPVLSVEPSSLSFGNQPVGQAQVLPLTLKSVGTSPVTVSSFALSGSAASDYRLVNPADCTGLLEVGMQCVLQVEVRPSASGARSASLSLTHTSAEPVSSVPLTTVGLVGVLEATPAVLAFSATETGKTSAQPVVLKNVGAASLRVNSATATSTAAGHAAQFTAGTTCSGQVLAVGANCTLSVTYAPTAVSSHAATLTFAHTGQSGATAISLAGSSKPPVTPVAALSSFTCPAPAAVGVPAVCTATLSNPGTVSWTFTGNGTSSNASLVPSLSGCSSPMVPAASCTVRLTGTFSAVSGIASTYQLVTSAQTLSAQASFAVEAPRATLAMAGHGAVLLGTPDEATHTLSNTGNLPVALTMPFKLGTGTSSAFSVVSSTCSSSLAAGASCSVVTRCTPASFGPLSGTLVLTSNAAPAVQGNLSCTGELAPANNSDLVATPATLDFGNWTVNSSRTLTVSVKNNGPRPIAISSLSLTGHTSSFTVANGNCASGLASAALAPGATCSFTVTAKPELEGLRQASVRILTNAAGTPKEVEARVVGVDPELLATPNPLNFGSLTTGLNRTLSVRLSNPGSVTTLVNSVSISAGASNYSVTGLCRNRSIPPGGFCDEFIRFNATATGAANGTLVVGYPSANAPLTISLTANQTAPVVPTATLTIRPHGTVTLGQSATVSHVISNTGTLSVSLSSAATVTGSGFSFVSKTCSTSLAPGASCEISTRCTPSVAGALSGTLTLASSAVPILSGSLSCAGEAAPLNASLVTFSPNPVNFGVLGVGNSSLPMTVTLRNTNSAGSAPVLLSNFVMGGAHASDFSMVSRGNCPAGLGAGQSCSFSMVAKPTAVGSRTATLTLDSNAPGAAPSLTLNATGGAASFTVTPTTVSFGTVTGGTLVPAQTVVIRNVGTVSGNVSSLLLLPGSSTAITYAGTCFAGSSLAPGASCTRVVGLNTQGVSGSVSGGFIANFSNGQPAQTVSVSASVTPAPVASGTLTLSCPATGLPSTPVTCTGVVTSTGTLPLNASTWSLARTVGAAVTYVPRLGAPECTSGAATALPAGQSCTASFSFTPTAPGLNTLRLQVYANTVLTPVTATVEVLGPKISLTTADHPATQVLTPSTARHTVSNVGPTVVNLTTVYASLPLLTIDRSACPSTLASGQSCVVTTTCRPTAVGVTKATLNVSGSAFASGSVSCEGVAAKVTASYDQATSSKVGGFTTSGNWVRLTNSGVGPVTLQSFAPALGWTLYGSPSVSSNCVVNKTLQPGESCSVVEALTGTQAPGTTVTGMQRIRSSAGDLVWTSVSLETLGLSFSPVTPFGDIQVGSLATAVYSMTNRAPVSTALPLTFVTNTPAFKVTSHTCPATLASGATCRLNLQYQAGLNPVTSMNLTLSATTGYPALLSGQLQAGAARSGVQGVLTAPLSIKAANVTLSATANAAIYVGQTAPLTGILRNDGIDSVTVSASPTVTGTQYSVVGGTCTANAVVPPASSCTVLIRFAPTSGMRSPTTLTVPTSVGPRTTTVAGEVYPASDVSVTVTGARTTLIDSTMSYALSVRNGVMGPMKVTVSLGLTPSQGARAYLSQFNGGICGNFTFNSAGGIVSQTVGPASTTMSCTPRLASGQLELTLPANGGYSATLVAAAGSEVGVATVSASATVSQATDPNAANNSASAATEITYPVSDMSISFSPLNASKFGIEGTQTVLATVRNTGVPQGASGRVSFTANSLTGGASLAVASMRCASKSANASCDSSGNVSLPANATAQYELVLNLGSAVGKAELVGNVVMTTPRLTDTPLTNNSAKLSFDIQAIPSAKWCTFNNPPGEVGINGGQRWAAGVGPFRAAAYSQGKYSPMINAADYYFSAVAYNDYNTGYFYWKGSNKPVTDAYGKHMQLTAYGAQPQRQSVFFTRVVRSDNIQAMTWADGNIAGYASSYGSAIVNLPSYYPDSALSSPGIKDSYDSNQYPPLRDTRGNARVFGANWVAGFNIYGGRGAPYSSTNSCYQKPGYAFYDYPEHCYYDGYLSTGASGGMQVVWQEYSVGASCGSTLAWRVR